MAWVFCRGAFVAVWKRNFILRPPFSRTPSAPRFQPAASRILLARSGSNSNFVFVEVNRGGLFR
jgi:hypothetical protein